MKKRSLEEVTGMKFYKKWYHPLLYAIVVGGLCGILLYRLLKVNHFEFQEYFNYGVSWIEDKENISKGDYLFFIWRKRMKEVLWIILFSFTIFSKVYNFFYCFITAMMHMLFLEGLMEQKGIKGILYFIGNCFPHYFLYIPIIAYVLYFSVQTRQYISNSSSSSWKRMCMKMIPSILLIFGLIFLECLVETYGNIEILKRIY